MNRIKCLGVFLAVTLLAGFMPVLATPHPASAQAPVWEKTPGNPVLENDPLAGGASVLYDPNANLYKMWYTNESADFTDFNNFITGIVNAAGATLIDDIKNFNFNDIPASSAGVSDVITYLAGLTTGELNGIVSSLAPKIAYATSSDGISWTTVNPGALEHGAPHGVSTPSVIYDTDANLFKMWFTGWSFDVNAIQGLFQTLNTLTPAQLETLLTELLVNNDLGAAVDSLTIGFAGDLLDDIEAILKGSGAEIGYATSTDGVTWGPPNLVPGVLKRTNDTWDQYGAGFPSVIKTATGYEMWYTGFNLNFENILDLVTSGGITTDTMKEAFSSSIELQIGRATSDDGTTWTKEENMLYFYLSPT